MPQELFDALLALASVIEYTFDGAADTGSSTTVLKDAALRMPANVYTRGTLLIRSGDPAIVRTSVEVEQHNVGNLVFAALAQPLVAGNLYTVVPASLGDRYQLVAAINLALKDLGELLTFNTALVVVSRQEEYALPTGVTKVRTVEVGDPAQAEPDYIPIGQPFWFETNDGKLKFKTGWAPGDSWNGLKFRLGYATAHPRVDADADDLLNGVNLERLKYEAKYYALVRALETGGQDAPDKPQVQIINQTRDAARNSAPHSVLRAPPVYRGLGASWL